MALNGIYPYVGIKGYLLSLAGLSGGLVFPEYRWYHPLLTD